MKQEWPLVKLNEACSLNMGQSPDSSGYNDEGKGLPFYQGNADFGALTPITRFFCNNPTKIAHCGDVLLSVRAPIGAVNIANETCCIGRGLAALTACDNVDAKFLYYAIKSKHDELNAKGTGSTFKAINKKALHETQIPLPVLAEQKNVVSILDNVSGLAALRKRQIMQLDLLAKSRFIEMFGDPVTNPKSWPVHQLSEYIQFMTSGSRGWARYFTDRGEYFITIKNVKNCRISLGEVQHVTPPNNAEAKRTKVQEGDLLISITADLGRTGVISKEIAEHGGYINQHLTCIRLCNTALDPLYVAYYMESDAGKEQFRAKNQSAVKAGLNFNSINSLRLLVPPLEQQKAFSSFIKQLDKSKFTIRKSLEQLETLYRALLQEYFG